MQHRQPKTGEAYSRDLTITERGIDEKARTVSIAFSSEEPYERWFGMEVLSHSRDCVRLNRLSDGAPLLVGHDGADQVGVVESVAIGADRVGRAVVRFGKSARASEIFQDVVDGIRRKASVGYIVHDFELDSQNGNETYRVTDWEPFEISLVAVPADNTVGVGRHIKPGEGKNVRDEDDGGGEGLTRRERRQQRENESRSSRELFLRENGWESEADRLKSFLAAGDNYAKFGGPEIARRMLDDPTATMDTFKRAVSDRIGAMSAARPATRTAQPWEDPTRPLYGEGARSTVYSGKLRAFEKEEEAYRAGMWVKAVLLGDKRAAQWCEMNGLMRDMGEGINSAGGATVPIEMSNAYIRLVEQYGVFRRNARIWPMGSDQLKIPRRKTGLSVFLVGEASAASTSDTGWDNVTLSPKKFATLLRVSNELIEDTAIALVEALMLDVALAFAQQEDNCGFNGDGTSQGTINYGGMRGLTQIFIDNNHNAGKITAASGHGTFGSIDATDLTKVMSALPLYARRNAKWYVSSVGNDLIFSRILASAGGNRLDILPQAIQPAFLGYPVEMSQVLPTSTGSLTGSVMALFGDLSLACAMGIRRALTVRQSLDRYLEQDQVAFMCSERFDIVNHSCGDNTTAGPIVALVGG